MKDKFAHSSQRVFRITHILLVSIIFFQQSVISIMIRFNYLLIILLFTINFNYSA
jgi:hypothetical protein